MKLFSKFKREGGRAGLIRVRENGMSGYLDWEMLTGDLDMGISGDSCRWDSPNDHAMSRTDVLRLAEELATDMKIHLEVTFPDGTSSVFPLEWRAHVDRKFFESLGAERTAESCGRTGCRRGRISHSSLCRVHHFESVRGRTCPFDD
jgi:hypothetical protein